MVVTVEDGQNYKNLIGRAKVLGMDGCAVGVIMGGCIVSRRAHWWVTMRGRHCNRKSVNIRFLVKVDLLQ
jgi:hypothetical protein